METTAPANLLDPSTLAQSLKAAFHRSVPEESVLFCFRRRAMLRGPLVRWDLHVTAGPSAAATTDLARVLSAALEFGVLTGSDCLEN